MTYQLLEDDAHFLSFQKLSGDECNSEVIFTGIPHLNNFKKAFNLANSF